MMVWILTSAYNEYDQFGEYFEAVFAAKPSIKQIQEICECTEDVAKHILAGGGRQGHDYSWYVLAEVECIPKEVEK